MSKNKTPLTVVVDDREYNCYGPRTLRSAWLMGLLKKQGGVSDTVAPGVYDFNARREGLHLVLSLDPSDTVI